jgi:Integrase core domain/GAG-pre-integrase domain
LISCSCLAASGISTNFHSKGCDLIDRNDHDGIIAKATLIDDLYRIQGANPGLATEHLQASSHEIDTVELWHNRLGHAGKDKILDMIRKDQLKEKIVANSDLCLDCSSGKQTRGPFKGHLDKAKGTGGVIHSDVLGPVPHSFGGYKYTVSFIDEWTRYITVFPMTHKSEVLKCFQEFRINFEKQYDQTIKSVHSDNGGEYTPVAKYAKEQGILVTRAAPYTPEGNGIAERMNRTLIEMVCTTLAQSGLPRSFWLEAMHNAVRIRNSIPNECGSNPHGSLAFNPPPFNAFRPFGCLAMMHARTGALKKLDVKSVPCVVLCTLDHKNYRLYDLNSRKIVIARNMVFDENKFPFKEPALRRTFTASMSEKNGLGKRAMHLGRSPSCRAFKFFMDGV